MADRSRPDPAKVLPLVTAAILAGSLVVLGVGYAVQRMHPPAAGLDVIVYVALAYALASPFVAGMVRSALPGPTTGLPPSDEDKSALLRRAVVSFAVLESAVFLCAVALMLTPSEWPLFAALVPLSAMILGRSQAV